MEDQNPFSYYEGDSAQTPPGTPPVTPVDSTQVSQDDRTMAMLAHLLGPVLGFLGPLIIWLIKKDESPFVDDQAKEALNFQITIMIAAMVSGVLMMACVGFVLLPVVVIADWVYGIIAALAANNGEYYRYPYTLRLIK